MTVGVRYGDGRGTVKYGGVRRSTVEYGEGSVRYGDGRGTVR